MDILLANPRGFCAGVDRAIAIVEQALAQFGAPIYVRHEVVHNKFVVDDLRDKGAVFVEELDDVPAGATVVFSAHGVSKAVRAEAEARGLHVFDATCPLVTKVHVEVAEDARAGPRDRDDRPRRAIPRSRARWGRCEGGIHLVDSVEDVARLVVSNPDRLAYVTQTTLSVDDAEAIVQALKARFPADRGTEARRHLLRHAEPAGCGEGAGAEVDAVIVVGSPNSSNSNRLREVAAHRGVPAYMVDRADELQPEWVAGQAPRRRHRRRVGARDPGAPGDRAPEGTGRARGDGAVGHGGERGVPDAQGPRRRWPRQGAGAGTAAGLARRVEARRTLVAPWRNAQNGGGWAPVGDALRGLSNARCVRPHRRHDLPGADASAS